MRYIFIPIFIINKNSYISKIIWHTSLMSINTKSDPVTTRLGISFVNLLTLPLKKLKMKGHKSYLADVSSLFRY